MNNGSDITLLGALSGTALWMVENRRATRIKVLVHDGFGVWLAARRLTQGKFHWPSSRHGAQMEFSPEQLQALVIGLPWQRLGSSGTVRML